MSRHIDKGSSKKKLTPSQERKKKKLAEKLKGKKGVKEPFALADFLAKKKKRKK